MSRDSFLRGALILTAAGVVVKLIGSVNRIFLSRLLGGEGIGLYQMAYPIYLLALSISSAGIPIAISIMVAEKAAVGDYRGASRIFRISWSILAITGLLCSSLLYWSAGWLTEHNWVRDERAYYAIAALAPAIFFVTVLSSYRGFFQGLQMMTPTAVSQIVEQLVRVVVMVALAYIFLPMGLEYAAAGASFGAAPGAAAALAVLMAYYWRRRCYIQRRMLPGPAVPQQSSWAIMKRMIKLALPVSLAYIMLPVVSSIDLIIVPARLEAAGYTVQQATELFGYLTGMATALINLPTILTGSLATSLVPSIAEAFTRKNHALICRRSATAIRISNTITIPSFAGMYLLAEPICQMLYDAPEAGTAVSILALGVIFLGIHQVSTGILQGLGRTAIPFINMLVAAAVKIILNWYLTAMPAWGVKGAAWATNADFAVGALLNMLFIYRYTGFCWRITDTLKAVLATFMMSAVVLYVYDTVMLATMYNTIATLAAIVSGCIVYAFSLLLLGGVQEGDVERIPGGGGILVVLLRRLGIFKKK
ncbi:putative membrane protein [Propionispora sp. 2/2-37]|uniref:putative polysaccharide biosynthesis protein n=1 Tax=Propionispora sp. 2/2-37 TaxID=1677858 RepID=UPI0006BB7986|nr:polysaccharide biosynthesis protein [Propionispora sp. 2/2-37]CUH96482.1 putative membrane protein [Propionispora sp. 2/2-37]